MNLRVKTANSVKSTPVDLPPHLFTGCKLSAVAHLWLRLSSTMIDASCHRLV